MLALAILNVATFVTFFKHVIATNAINSVKKNIKTKAMYKYTLYIQTIILVAVLQ